MVDPSSEEEIGQHERGVEIPDAAPQERFADEQQQTDGIVVDQKEPWRNAAGTSTAATAWCDDLIYVLLLLLMQLLIILDLPSYLTP